MDLFKGFSDQSRVWFYFFDKKLDDEKKNLLVKQLDHFMNDWNSHKENVTGAYHILYDQLAVLCTEHDGISGCSIDSSVRIFKDFKTEHGLDALDRNNIFFRDSHGDIQSVKRYQFSTLFEEKKVLSTTCVFDLTLQTLGECRDKAIERPLQDSWHAKLLPAPN